MSRENLIEITSVDRSYVDTGDNTVEALREIGLSVLKGEFISIIGPSG
jgi:NitT/TauT family transport system ATP-binding protein/sulfonate transport system ATP-binding protein